MAKRAPPQDTRRRQHDNSVRHAKPPSTSVGTHTAELETVLTLQCAFMGAHEIAVSVIENSRDDKKFVVEEVDENGQWVCKNHFFTDIFDAVDFYGMRLKQGVLPRDPAADQHRHSKKRRSNADCRAESTREKPRDSCDVPEKVVSCGDVEMWNVVGGYGFVRDDESQQTIFFHTTHKHLSTWMPMRGDAVQYRIGFDPQKNRVTAFDIGLRHPVAPSDFAFDGNSWQNYFEKFYRAMQQRTARH